jgi:hypothetical protein
VHRLGAAGVAFLIVAAGCSPTPSASPGASSIPTTPSTSPSSSVRPGASPVETPASPGEPSAVPPVGIDLPAPYSNIPWAHFDRETGVLSIGVVGKPAVTTRTTDSADSVLAVGTAVLVPNGDETEIVDAATGATVARFKPDALRPPASAQPDGQRSLRDYFNSRYVFQADVAHGALYQLGATAKGIGLWRFDLDGSGKTLMATLGPDPETDDWEHVEYTLTPAGTMIAVACPERDSKVSDHRCRLWRIPAGATPPIAPKMLPIGTPAPCGIRGASERYIVWSVWEGCGADGGWASTLTFAAVDLRTGKVRTELGPSEYKGFAVEGDDFPYLLGNVFPEPFGPRVFPAVAAIFQFEDNSIGQPLSELISKDPESTPYPADQIWALLGSGQGWRMLQPFGHDFGVCRLTQANDRCPVGAAWLNAPLGGLDSWVELPVGTYGEILSPHAYIGGASDALPIAWQ